ncbi:MAG: hypothetical protein LRY51_00135 [Geovibrio sp.]|nr:hypothetical protein [Geovibrio sp.]
MLKSNIRFNLIRGGQHFVFGDITVFAAEGNHPDGALMYKIKDGNITTLSPPTLSTERRGMIFSLSSAAAATIWSLTQHTRLRTTKGKGTALPKRAGGTQLILKVLNLRRRQILKNLVLYHHNPDYKDAELDAMFEEAKKVFPATICSYDGFEIK